MRHRRLLAAVTAAVMTWSVAGVALASAAVDAIVADATAQMDTVVSDFAAAAAGLADADAIDALYADARKELVDIRNAANASLAKLDPSEASGKEVNEGQAAVRTQRDLHRDELDTLYTDALTASSTTTTTTPSSTTSTTSSPPTTTPPPAAPSTTPSPSTTTPSPTAKVTTTLASTTSSTAPPATGPPAPATTLHPAPVGAHDPALATPAPPSELEPSLAGRLEHFLATVFPPRVVVAVAAPLTLVEAVVAALLDGGRELVVPGLATGMLVAALVARRPEDEDRDDPDG